MKRPILIIDIEKNRFAYRDTNNLNPCYTVAELKDGVFRIDSDAYQTEQDTSSGIKQRRDPNNSFKMAPSHGTSCITPTNGLKENNTHYS
mgnify:CR=1 FL=1